MGSAERAGRGLGSATGLQTRPTRYGGLPGPCGKDEENMVAAVETGFDVLNVLSLVRA
jgi:hypothetical protein